MPELTGEALLKLYQECAIKCHAEQDGLPSILSMYNMLADNLNQQYSVSLQVVGGITGQAIHDIYEQREPTALPWDRISEHRKTEYNLIAEKLNAQYLAPLQGLVRDLEQTFITDSNIQGEKIAHLERQNDALKAMLTSCCAFIEKTPFMDREAWLTESLELFRSAKLLLKDESDSKNEKIVQLVEAVPPASHYQQYAKWQEARNALRTSLKEEQKEG